MFSHLLSFVTIFLKAYSQAYILITLIPEMTSFMIRTRWSVTRADLNLERKHEGKRREQRRRERKHEGERRREQTEMEGGKQGRVGRVEGGVGEEG